MDNEKWSERIEWNLYVSIIKLLIFEGVSVIIYFELL